MTRLLPRLLWLALAGFTAVATPTLAETRTPIRTFDLPQLQRMGVALYRQDLSAWRATDAVAAKVPDLAAAGLKGWLVEDDGKVAKVRFLRDLGRGLEVGYDVEVSAKGVGPVTEPRNRGLTGEERAMFAARQTAASFMSGACRPGYNSAVIKDPDGDGWLVWMLAPSPGQGVIPVGGHYRFTISADGSTVEERDALSASCLTIAQPRLPPGAKTEGMVVSHLVSPTPVETHVFLSLLYRQPMYVTTGKGELWVVGSGQIAPVQLKP